MPRRRVKPAIERRQSLAGDAADRVERVRLALDLIRQISGITLSQMADDLGYSDTTVTKVLAGTQRINCCASRNPESKPHLFAFLRYFGLDPREFLEVVAAGPGDLEYLRQAARDTGARRKQQGRLTIDSELVSQDQVRTLEALRAVLRLCGLAQHRVPGLVEWTTADRSSLLTAIFARANPLRLDQLCEILDYSQVSFPRFVALAWPREDEDSWRVRGVQQV